MSDGLEERDAERDAKRQAERAGDVPGDDVPEYPEDDPDGDRAEYITAPEHRNLEDVPDDELDQFDTGF